MRQSFVPVLLLTAVALSTSNVLPKFYTHQQDSQMLAIHGQQDNTLSDRYNTRDDSSNIFYTVPIGTFQNDRQREKISNFIKSKNIRGENNVKDMVDKADNYNGEGFRKEQWHNYPRQLDRLHDYLFEHNIDSFKGYRGGDDTDGNDAPETEYKYNDGTTLDAFLRDNIDGVHKIYDAVVAANNPLLVLKVHLACLDNGMKISDFTKHSQPQSFQIEPNIENENTNEDEHLFAKGINPGVKVKREGETLLDSENIEDNTTEMKTPINKRLFSLWSRLQSLSHRGHELPHRRHLHAFYGLPDADGNGVLTAEPRATLMRPPGSPLRWG